MPNFFILLLSLLHFAANIFHMPYTGMRVISPHPSHRQEARSQLAEPSYFVFLEYD